MADLMRISGVGQEYPELLGAAGIGTIKALRNRNADNLAAKMAEVNAGKKQTRTASLEKTLADRVWQAKSPDPMITHQDYPVPPDRIVGQAEYR